MFREIVTYVQCQIVEIKLSLHRNPFAINFKVVKRISYKDGESFLYIDMCSVLFTRGS